jgi:hypothetical protein
LVGCELEESGRSGSIGGEAVGGVS